LHAGSLGPTIGFLLQALRSPCPDELGSSRAFALSSRRAAPRRRGGRGHLSHRKRRRRPLLSPVWGGGLDRPERFGL